MSMISEDAGYNNYYMVPCIRVHPNNSVVKQCKKYIACREANDSVVTCESCSVCITGLFSFNEKEEFFFVLHKHDFIDYS